MFLEVYNQLMSDMLNQKYAFAKLRTELKRREERICRKCGRFGHLAWKYRSKEKQKKKIVVVNRFEMLGSQVMQYGVREVRRQEIIREEATCFGCRKKGHKKWECLQKKERRREEAALLRKVWGKIKKYCGAKELLPRKAVMSMEGWTMRWEVVTLVECRGYDYKGTKTQENQGQGFLGKEQMCNM